MEDDKRESILEFTRLLRTDKGPFWERLRDELTTRGIDPAKTILVDSFEDDYRFEFGILVTAAGRVVRYGYDFYPHGDVERGTFTDWTDLTDGYSDTLYRSAIDTALALRDA